MEGSSDCEPVLAHRHAALSPATHHADVKLFQGLGTIEIVKNRRCHSLTKPYNSDLAVGWVTKSALRPSREQTPYSLMRYAPSARM